MEFGRKQSHGLEKKVRNNQNSFSLQQLLSNNKMAIVDKIKIIRTELAYANKEIESLLDKKANTQNFNTLSLKFRVSKAYIEKYDLLLKQQKNSEEFKKYMEKNTKDALQQAVQSNLQNISYFVLNAKINNPSKVGGDKRLRTNIKSNVL